jgi:hypothetical protein
MRQADGQGYQPRYGLTSAQFLNTLAANVPASQLAGSVALGWWPSADLPSGSVVRTPGRTRCVAALAKAGIHYGVNSSQEQSAFAQCDMVFAAVDSARASGDTSPAGVLRGAGVLGPRWASAAAVQSSFATRDGASGYRVALFTSGCSCFRYSGVTRPID